MAKYKLTNEKFKTASGKILYRIQAVQNIYHNKRLIIKGEMGGYVESPANLSQEGNCWLGGNAMSLGKTIIENDAWVDENAVVFGNSVITDSAVITGNTFVDSTTVADTCEIKDNANVKDSQLSGAVIIEHKATVEKCSMDGTINVMEKARVFASTVKGKDLVFMRDANVDMSDIGGVSTYDTPENVVIGGKSSLYRTQIFGKDITISGEAKLGKDVLLVGEHIRIGDYSDLKGKIEVLSNVTILEMAVVQNLTHMALHLDDTRIDGDTFVNEE